MIQRCVLNVFLLLLSPPPPLPPLPFYRDVPIRKPFLPFSCLFVCLSVCLFTCSFRFQCFQVDDASDPLAVGLRDEATSPVLIHLGRHLHFHLHLHLAPPFISSFLLRDSHFGILILVLIASTAATALSWRWPRIGRPQSDVVSTFSGLAHCCAVPAGRTRPGVVGREEGRLVRRGRRPRDKVCEKTGDVLRGAERVNETRGE